MKPGRDAKEVDVLSELHKKIVFFFHHGYWDCFSKSFPTQQFTKWKESSSLINKKLVGTYLVVVLLFSDGFREAKVTDLGVVLSDQQHVPGSEVSVHKVMLLQVLHSHGHLVDQLCEVLYCRLSVDDQSKKLCQNDCFVDVDACAL